MIKKNRKESIHVPPFKSIFASPQIFLKKNLKSNGMPRSQTNFSICIWLDFKNVAFLVIILTVFFFFKFQDEFAGMRDNYYRTGHGFILCYSVDQKSSLDDVRERFNGILTTKVRITNFFVTIICPSSELTLVSQSWDELEVKST